MKLNKIKNMNKTGAKVLLFCILAVTLGFSMSCRSGGDGGKGDTMNPGDTITDAEAVQRAKDNLMIIYAAGDSESSVTQNVTLPTTAENGVAVSWVSGNSSVVAIPPPPPPPDSEQITGTVNRPNDQDTQVTLTATLTKNEASDERAFTLTVILLEDAAAVQQAKNALMIGYAAGDQAESVTQDVMLPTAGANGVSISWETSDAARVSTTGTVSRPNDQNTQVTLTATLTKNAASDERAFTLTVILLEDAAAVQQAKNALMIGYAAGDSAESVTQDVMLPTEGSNGVSISWASSDAARVSTTGAVSQPDDTNTEVTLTATLTKNTARDERRFTLTVIISEDGMDVEIAKNALMIGYAAGDSQTSVTQDVMLPTAGANGVSVSWASSDAARISTTGTVSRPNDQNTQVTLTATLTKNAASDERAFTLTVILLEDDAAVEMAKNALMIGYAAGDRAESVTQDVMLPTGGANGVSISWASSDTDRLSTTGTVSRPDDANTQVTLTATLTKNTTRDERRFTLTVIISEDGMAVEQAKNALAIIYATGDSRTSVTQDVMLPTAGANGVAVSWASSDAARISTTGTVSRPDDQDTEVILTATLTKNTARDERAFTLTVTLPCGTTDEIVTKLSAMPPSLSGCSAVGIRGADMPALVSAGATKEQLLAVWSANADTGFTPAQLKAAGVTVTEMREASLTILQIYTGGVSIADLLGAGLTITQLDTGSVPDHAIFSEACGTPERVDGATGHPSITSVGLDPNNTKVVLTGKAEGLSRWVSNELLGMDMTINFDNTDPTEVDVVVGVATARLISVVGNIVSTLSIPLANVFSNPEVRIANNQLKSTNIRLCPCAVENPPDSCP